LYPQNKRFVDRLGSSEAAISAFTLLEICGAASFRLSNAELESWLLRFTAFYPVRVLDAFGLAGRDAGPWWQSFIAEVSGNVLKKMTFGDAVLLREAEHYAVEAIVTWNIRDFSRRTRLPICTPHSLLTAPTWIIAILRYEQMA